MRIIRSYTIEVDNVRRLKELGSRQASDLINKLLSDYFDKIELNNLTKEELQREIRLEELKQEYERKKEAVINGQN